MWGTVFLTLGIIILVILIFGIVISIFRKLTVRRNDCYTCLNGKTVVVTGANTGIGYTTALDFAMRGAQVILACRDQEKAERARQNIVNATGNKNIVVKIVDFQSLESVRAFAKNINETEERLDILVNNAGATDLGNHFTKDGLQITMQTNYFAPFLLTHLLIGKLKSSAPSRIVNVSSVTVKYLSNFDIGNINNYPEGSQSHAEVTLYVNSKLCNIFFTKKLAKILEGTGISVNCLHPGMIMTELVRDVKGFRLILYKILSKFYLLTAELGAQTTIYVAVSKEAGEVSGKLFSNCQQVEMYKAADDEVIAQKVWEKSEEFVKLRKEEKLF